MTVQTTFLPKIDRKETQRRVEEALEKARIFKEIGFVRREISNTPSYEPRYHGATNKTGAPAEECATYNVAKETELEEHLRRVELAVSRLSKRQRDIINKRYLQDADALDYLVYNEMGLSERQYYRAKADAFYKLAFMLRLEVYSDEEESA